MNLFKKIMVAPFMVALAVASGGCTSTSSNPRDPLEPMNRVVYRFNDKADTYVMKPVAQTYRDVTPQPVRIGITNFFSNLGDASSSVNFALQGKTEPALYNLTRFLLNTTVGLLGFVDVTQGDQRLHGQTGFGDTFAQWGWKNSRYLVMPLMGPSTLRDGAGTVSGMGFQNRVIYGSFHADVSTVSGAVGAVSAREKFLGLDDALKAAALDPYAYIRDGWLQIRAREVGEDAPQSAEDDMDIDDLVE
jgi:phospholipid-binding lipoprotein MlaA